MIHKYKLYPEEQKAVRAELITILELDDQNSFLLSFVKDDTVKQKKIMDLLPKIRTYFSTSHIPAFAYPENAKRAWLSIIRHLLKGEYNMKKKAYQKMLDTGKYLRTIRYYFTKIEDHE